MLVLVLLRPQERLEQERLLVQLQQQELLREQQLHHSKEQRLEQRSLEQLCS